jgi:hypothetical protein
VKFHGHGRGEARDFRFLFVNIRIAASPGNLPRRDSFCAQTFPLFFSELTANILKPILSIPSQGAAV